jgi:glycosyltransferase involved in cell wall biosynthesis
MTVPVDTETVFETKARDLDGEGVTVIVTLYNYQAFIRNALDSVVRQNHPNIELVVVDDGSQDNSRATAREWLEENGTRFSQARLLSHTKNSGLAQARNTAFLAATNEFVFVLDADNEIYPDAIAKLLAACMRQSLKLIAVISCGVPHVRLCRRRANADGVSKGKRQEDIQPSRSPQLSRKNRHLSIAWNGRQ